MRTRNPGPRSRLDRRFFARPTLEVARDLLGRHLVRRLNGARLVGRIVEAEAYIGGEDSACHASRGRTRRNEIMFGPPGLAYVYFTYGMHWMLNVVTEAEGRPAAVLLRAIEPLRGLEIMRRLRRGRPDRELASGPARLSQALAVDGALCGVDLVAGRELHFERGTPVPDDRVGATARVGIHYARPEDIEAPWRLFVHDSPFVSRARPSRVAAPRSRRRNRP